MIKHKQILNTLIITVAVFAVTFVPVNGDSKAGLPDYSVSSDKYPNDDAVILRWDQHWTVNKDKSVTCREHKWIKLFNNRPTRVLADPRIDYCKNVEEYKIHKAQTILPDGNILPVPEYSFNVAGPNDVAGWPEYANWEQTVISFSGFQPNAVLELDYEITTKANVLPWIWADLQLHDDYPTIERNITVNLPKSRKLNSQVVNIDNTKEAKGEVYPKGGRNVYAWSFSNLEGRHSEPQSLPWQKRCGRLIFTTCKDSNTWVGEFTSKVEQASMNYDGMETKVRNIIGNETSQQEQISKIADYVHNTFSYVDSLKTYRTLKCRNASDVMSTNYGNPLEASAMMLGMFRSIGIDASPYVVVDAISWSEEVPTESMFDGVAIVANVDGEELCVHPRHGLFSSPGNFGHRIMLKSAGKNDKPETRYVYARGENKPSNMDISGELELDAAGKISGDIKIKMTGVFYDYENLQKSDAQKSFVGKTIKNVFSELEVENYSIVRLSDNELQADVKVKTTDKSDKVAGMSMFVLGDGPAFLSDVHMPLDCTTRETDVQLSGAFNENINVVVAMPDEWLVSVKPDNHKSVSGSWGQINQTVVIKDKNLHINRTVNINRDVIKTADFDKIRSIINGLRTANSRDDCVFAKR